MRKSEEKLKKRQELIKEIIDKPQIAAERVELLLVSLRNSRKIDERIKIAAELLQLSEGTIFRDYMK